MLPHVIEYNAQKPTKFTAWPKYQHYTADQNMLNSQYLGLPASTTQEGVQSLSTLINRLMKELNMPMTIAECGVSKDEFEAKIKELADKAFEDQCTTANPRMPLVTELEEIPEKPMPSNRTGKPTPRSGV